VRLFSQVPVPLRHAGGYLKGWYNPRKLFLYVFKGFGTPVAPGCIGARPEITLFLYGV
jgi:predicted MPP superfamily phosphohydrolase